MAKPSDRDLVLADLVIVCPHLGDGGAQRVITTLANAWSERGRGICVVTLDEQADSYRLDSGVVRIRMGGLPGAHATWRRRIASSLGRLRVVRRFGFYLLIWRGVATLRRVMQRVRAPVVLAFLGPCNVMTILACRALGRRVIISERNDPARQPLRHPWNFLRRLCYRHADVVSANSRGALDTMRSYVPERKLALVPNPLVLPQGSSDGPAAAPGAAPSLLTVGRLQEQKAHDILLEAFARLPAAFASWRLTIVGRGELEKALRVQAAALGIAERIVWHGQVPDPFAFYRAASIFVLPSRYEGMPNALLEAMSCGVPVVVSDASPGPLEVVKHMETGLVVPVDDAGALASAIELVGADVALARKLGDAGRRRVSEYALPKALAAWDRVIGWQPAITPS